MIFLTLYSNVGYGVRNGYLMVGNFMLLELLPFVELFGKLGIKHVLKGK
jgi:hypothetical protein